MKRNGATTKSRFERHRFSGAMNPGALPQGLRFNAAPLALNTYDISASRLNYLTSALVFDNARGRNATRAKSQRHERQAGYHRSSEDAGTYHQTNALSRRLMN
jgi:hypothetical protein